MGVTNEFLQVGKFTKIESVNPEGGLFTLLPVTPGIHLVLFRFKVAFCKLPGAHANHWQVCDLGSVNI